MTPPASSRPPFATRPMPSVRLWKPPASAPGCAAARSTASRSTLRPYLLAASMLGFDPVTGKPKRGQPIGPLHMPSLSAAIRIKRIQDGVTLRQAAKSARMSYSTLGRIERGEAVSIEAIIAACTFIDRHPFDFVSPDISRETFSAERRSAA